MSERWRHPGLLVLGVGLLAAAPTDPWPTEEQAWDLGMRLEALVDWEQVRTLQRSGEGRVVGAGSGVLDRTVCWEGLPDDVAICSKGFYLWEHITVFDPVRGARIDARRAVHQRSYTPGEFQLRPLRDADAPLRMQVLGGTYENVSWTKGSPCTVAGARKVTGQTHIAAWNGPADAPVDGFELERCGEHEIHAVRWRDGVPTGVIRYSHRSAVDAPWSFRRLTLVDGQPTLETVDDQGPRAIDTGLSLTGARPLPERVARFPLVETLARAQEPEGQVVVSW